jgi:uncharacterized protein YdeI (YjbR/CyaY-like superfamily)
MAMKPTFFGTSKDFRRWLERNHDKADELLVGFWKRDSGKPSITWPESVDEALCFGWIDGVRRRIDDQSYSIRFTPRRRGSIWSMVNIKRATELEKLGRMAPAGLRAFEARDEKKSAVYAYENRPRQLAPEYETLFRANAKAWQYWNAQPAGYRRIAIYFVMEAKREGTRARRLAQLIDDSAHGRRLGQYTLESRKR